MDFRTAYYSGQCIIHYPCDPYSESDIQHLYGRWPERAILPGRILPVVTRNIYLPVAFPFTVPLALFPFRVAEAAWLALIVASFVLATFLMWNLGALHAPVLSGSLLGFCLANSGSIIFFGNPAGFVVPLAVIAAWCFIQDRFVAAGIACLAVGLAFKPHDAALVWLFFLLAGGIYRRRALQTLAVFLAFGLPAVLWVTHVAPTWRLEIASNLHVFTDQGGMNDPSGGHGACVLTNLQAVTSFFWASPHTYDLVSYLACLPLLLIWGYFTWRMHPSAAHPWLGLASVSALSMLPVYHRQYDAKLIILAIPALAVLWARRRPLRWIALVITCLAFILNGDIPWVIFLTFVNKMHPASAGPYSPLLTAVWDFPVPLSLLLLGALYLWIYGKAVLGSPYSMRAQEQQSLAPQPASAN